MLRDIWKAVYLTVEKKFKISNLKKVGFRGSNLVVPQKDSVVKCLYYNHPMHGDITAYLRKSKIKYGGY